MMFMLSLQAKQPVFASTRWKVRERQDERL